MALRSGQYRSNFHFGESMAFFAAHADGAHSSQPICIPVSQSPAQRQCRITDALCRSQCRLCCSMPHPTHQLCPRSRRCSPSGARHGIDCRSPVERSLGCIYPIKAVLTLPPVPGFQYANLLRTVILQARRQNVLPPRSRFPSPDPPKTFQTPDAIDSQVNFPLPPIKSTEPPFDFLAHSNSPLDSVNSGNFFDFGYAEQLFSDQQGPLDVSQQVLVRPRWHVR